MSKHTERIDIAVVGGGAAGLVAAIMAARAGAKVLILEHNEVLGKKILATGNGKCNYTNKMQGVDKYYGQNPAFVAPVFEQFGLEETLQFFMGLGIYPKERNGGYYPQSEQAAAIRDVLQMELQKQHVGVVCSCGIRGIEKTKKGFVFHTKGGDFYATKCIMATGGKTLKKSGSDGSGFLYLESLGHHIIDLVPGLVGLKGKQSFFADIAGIRADAKIDLYIENAYVCSERGELQLTNYGISGIPVFQISRVATRALSEQKKVYATLNFVPFWEKEQCLTYFKERFKEADEKRISEALIGFFPEKLIPVLLEESHIKAAKYANRLQEEEIKRFVDTAQGLRVDITDWNTFDTAQVTAGGVDTAEINAETMESKLCPGLYFAGEMVDIDGICGGYNLQWAWSSGAVAGMHAARELS